MQRKDIFTFVIGNSYIIDFLFSHSVAQRDRASLSVQIDLENLYLFHFLGYIEKCVDQHKVKGRKFYFLSLYSEREKRSHSV